MDVYGKAPKSENGKYFRASVWSWHPLWDYCCHVAPEITVQVKYGHYNYGDGLDGYASGMLSKVLYEQINSGETAKYASERQKYLDSLPDKICSICEGTGKRLPPPNAGKGNYPCNGCKKTGRVRPNICMYGFSVEDVKEFAEFLAECGGFVIN
jgi:hypothetical protein